ncbi:MAG: polysaccharide deacetylase family protein [Lachnospiraceae bacterium]
MNLWDDEEREKKRKVREKKVFLTKIGLAALTVVIVLIIMWVVNVNPRLQANAANNDALIDQGEVSQAAETAQDTAQDATLVPLKNAASGAKMDVQGAGWQTNEEGTWYQYANGSYYVNGFVEIDGATYYVNENGYRQTGWIIKGDDGYFFNEDGTLDPEKQRPLLALTFDDGPGKYTQRLLDILKTYNVKATFFMLGQCVAKYPEVLTAINADGHEIGNHSYSHAKLNQLQPADIQAEFANTNNLIASIIGTPATLARTPYGMNDQAILNQIGMPCILWNVDTLDWQSKDPASITNIALSNASDGGIILMHDIYETTVDAVEQMLPTLLSQGYKLVTVSELAQAKGVSLQAGSWYADFVS